MKRAELLYKKYIAPQKPVSVKISMQYPVYCVRNLSEKGIRFDFGVILAILYPRNAPPKTYTHPQHCFGMLYPYPIPRTGRISGILHKIDPARFQASIFASQISILDFQCSILYPQISPDEKIYLLSPTILLRYRANFYQKIICRKIRYRFSILYPKFPPIQKRTKSPFRNSVLFPSIFSHLFAHSAIFILQTIIGAAALEAVCQKFFHFVLIQQ